MSGGIEIFPKALVTAARTFAKKPSVVGEVLVALVAADGAAAGKTLSEVQQYIVAACQDEMEELAARRAVATERKRRQRERDREVKK